MSTANTVWLIAVCLGIPSTLWLVWKINTRFTLLDLLGSIFVGVMMGPLPILVYWAAGITLWERES